MTLLTDLQERRTQHLIHIEARLRLERDYAIRAVRSPDRPIVLVDVLFYDPFRAEVREAPANVYRLALIQLERAYEQILVQLQAEQS